MSALKILITGGSGLLGQYLNMFLSHQNKIFTLYNSTPGNCLNYKNSKADITNLKLLEELFLYFMPDIVIHTAAISRIDLADKLPHKYVIDVNVRSTEKLSHLCKKYKSKLFYTSTDLVYDSSFGSMLLESAPLNPVSFYAETKLMGENRIKENFDNYIILRTALLYGFAYNHTVNHFHSMYNNLKAGKAVKLFYDQYRTPLALKEAARIITELIERNISGLVINFGGKERVSRLEIGEILCEEAGFDKELIIKTSMSEFPEIPETPDVSMSTAKLNSFDVQQKSIRESVKEMLPEFTSKLKI